MICSNWNMEKRLLDGMNAAVIEKEMTGVVSLIVLS